ncbi:MAG: M23 family metallopeptidase [Rubrobacteraceae bacterium]
MILKKAVFAFCGMVMFVGLAGMPGSGESFAQARDAEPVERTSGGSVVGASIAHPEKWVVERESNEYDDTTGFVVWERQAETVKDHGGTPRVRVALAHEMKPGEINKTIRERLAEYPGLPQERREVQVGKNDLTGVAVGPIPGSTPSTEIYVPVEDRVYQINVYDERLDAGDQEILSSLKFYEPSRSVDSLDLEDAAPEPQTPQDEARFEDAIEDSAPEENTFSGQGGAREKRISQGCWRADPRFFVQTQHDSYANSRRGDGVPTGWTVVGRPNFWGQYTHGNIGQGRCVGRYNTNDKFAVDYPFDRGDRIFSPFKKGTVVFAGRNNTHRNYGRFVVIRSSGGKYVSASAHLNSIPSSIRRGKTVTKNSVIGYAGNTGGDIAVGEVHLHQAFYRYPKFNPDGSPYGGAGLQVNRPRYSGTAAKRLKVRSPRNIYRFAQIRPNYKRYCNERRTCGEGYKISN